MIQASVIILNYNGKTVLKETVQSVLKSDFPQDKFEIIVVDNNSQDGSREIVEQLAKSNPERIIPLLLPHNTGFGLGNNQGFKIAKGQYIALLNNDCIIDKNWLSELVKAARSEFKVFSVGSKIKLFPPEKNLVQNAGSLVFQDGYGRDIGAIVTPDRQQLYEQDSGQFDRQKEVYSTCGASVLYNKNILEKIGYFDDNFFMYYEDTEICERARLAGYKNIYCPTAVCYHNHAHSSKEWSPFFIYNVEKGRLLHLIYHFPLSVFFSQYFKFTLKAKIRFARSLLRSKDINKSWQYLRVSLYFFVKLLPLIIRRRKFHKIYSPKNRQTNFDKILSGCWYLN